MKVIEINHARLVSYGLRTSNDFMAGDVLARRLMLISTLRRGSRTQNPVNYSAGTWASGIAASSARVTASASAILRPE